MGDRWACACRAPRKALPHGMHSCLSCSVVVLVKIIKSPNVSDKFQSCQLTLFHSKQQPRGTVPEPTSAVGECLQSPGSWGRRVGVSRGENSPPAPQLPPCFLWTPPFSRAPSGHVPSAPCPCLAKTPLEEIASLSAKPPPPGPHRAGHCLGAQATVWAPVWSSRTQTP